MQLLRQHIEPDEWASLKVFTNARIALGSTGVSIPLKEMLALRLAHAQAREAVYSLLESGRLTNELQQMQLAVMNVRSKARSREYFLQRPDYGRMLDDFSKDVLAAEDTSCDVAVILADGLSATAINTYAIPLLQRLIPLLKSNHIKASPMVIAEQARVALSDEIGYLLKAKLSVILIGERPGLTTCDSMGAYITFQPKPGTTDEARNCISNIHASGLHYTIAAEKIFSLVQTCLQKQVSGITLKEGN